MTILLKRVLVVCLFLALPVFSGPVIIIVISLWGIFHCAILFSSKDLTIGFYARYFVVLEKHKSLFPNYKVFFLWILYVLHIFTLEVSADLTLSLYICFKYLGFSICVAMVQLVFGGARHQKGTMSNFGNSQVFKDLFLTTLQLVFSEYILKRFICFIFPTILVCKFHKYITITVTWLSKIGYKISISILMQVHWCGQYWCKCTGMGNINPTGVRP